MSERTELILSLNRALLGEVTPNIRAAIIKKEEDRIYLKFVLYDQPTDEEIEIFNVIGGEVIADFNRNQSIVESYEIQKSGRINILDDEELVYRRRD